MGLLMNRKLGGLLISVVSSLVGFWASSSPTNAGDFFKFSLSIRGCLAVEGAEGSNPGEFRIADPCRSTPDARVEAIGDVLGDGSSGIINQASLIIHLSKQEIRCLGVTLPPVGEIIKLPQIVSTSCALRTQWNIRGGGSDGRRFIVVHREGDPAMCLQTRKGPTGNFEVIIDGCTSGDVDKWILEPIPAPNFP